MKPDGTKLSTFSVQNNLGGARILSERIVSALDKLQLNEVTIGMEATSIYGDSLVYSLREDGKLGQYQRHPAFRFIMDFHIDIVFRLANPVLHIQNIKIPADDRLFSVGYNTRTHLIYPLTSTFRLRSDFRQGHKNVPHAVPMNES